MRTRTHLNRRPAAQSGFALIVALLLMVGLTLVGVASLRSVTLQERMAGNTYYRTISSHETDGGIRLARASIDKVRLDSALQFGSNVSPGWTDSVADASVSYWSSDANWSTAQSSTPIGKFTDLQNKWQIETLSGGTNPKCPRASNSGTGANKCPVIFFRSTARSLDSVTGAATAAQDWSMFPAD
jgi:type IV pilus assembly protein PilX